MFNCWLFYPYTEISIEHRTNFPRSGHNRPMPEPSPHAPTLISSSSPAPANPHQLLAFGEDLVSSRRAPPEKLTGEIRCWKFPLESISTASLLSFLVFTLMLARWSLPLLLFVLCWLIGWLVAFYRSTIESRFFFTHANWPAGFRAAVWTGERGRNWGERGKIVRGKVDRARNYV